MQFWYENKIADKFSVQMTAQNERHIETCGPWSFTRQIINWDRECWLLIFKKCFQQLTWSWHNVITSYPIQYNKVRLRFRFLFFPRLQHFNACNFEFGPTIHFGWVSVGSCFEKSKLISNFQHIQGKTAVKRNSTHLSICH